MPAISDPAVLRELVAAAPVGRLATVRADGSPRLVPITFALVEDRICSVVDAVKPKRTPKLARLADVARDPRVGLVVDHYADDWSRLWWVRVDGTATVADPDEQALDALAAKYPPYRDPRPAGPLLVITPTRWTGWAAT
ncbi:TIGR03668 family PPOX class F420-dependent oxidoreductase [Pseudonocardia sp.]|uniref:TIGR03668 family PPOX class F420-dependent oxidoreductase n=1 Tax=Pseudonocardia sp. TaxID=60912 RepID=UPI003D0C3868